MIEKLFAIEAKEYGQSSHEPPNPPAPAGYFSHISECSVCRYGSHGLCETGEALLDLAAGIGQDYPEQQQSKKK